ncbi:radical SAM family heme chaperone HemW [Helicobacter sp. UBA3407]|uniref:radical SAM family heme chaperone HemW n=1 Tax=Helicobacter TaxID=209 RepID=UPI00260DB074|nr:radical SAM family heme chaperone HemW [Helicobacter sp. UBA3407]
MESQIKLFEISLYLHIPFCDSKCGYCAFNSQINKNHLKTIYMETLARYVSYKIHNLLEENQNLQITSVYIGGGTPNSVKSRAYSSLFAEFSPYLAPQAEISIEANPNSLSLEWLQTLQSLGVNRLSLGAQSFEDSKLIFLERHHRKDSIFYAIEMALKAGLKNLSIDLIYGTPLCNASLLTQELETACALPLSHLSAYQLSIDEGSRFYANKESLGNLRDFEGEFEGFLSMGHFIKSYLQTKGFKQYEVSNYAKTSPSYHNLRYWEGKEYLGIGAGAVGFQGGVRTSMPKSIEKFLSGFYEEKEILSTHNQLLEHLFLGFRSCVGVERKRIPNTRNLKILLEENKVEQDGERIYAKDYFLGDEIALFVG